MRGIFRLFLLLPLATIGASPTPVEANPALKEAVPTLPEANPQDFSFKQCKQMAQEDFCMARYVACQASCVLVCPSCLLLTFFANNL
jgi:hypothetical protein